MGNEQDLLRKVSALLAKAEGTDNEFEASAFFEKAHALMVQYSIDEARVRAEERRRNGKHIEEPVVEDYMFSSYAHHAQAKENLLAVIAAAHSVKSFPYPNRKYSNAHRVAAVGSTGLHESQWTKLVGYKDDIENVKILYLNILIQGQRFGAEDWRKRYGDAKYSSWDDGHLGKFTWLSGYLEGFADRIGERFHEVTEEVYRSSLDGRELIVDKDANILEWMYEHGLAHRPRPVVERCWATGRPPGKRSDYYCIKIKDHEDPHAYTYKPTYSSYVGVGRRESYEGRNAGRSGADRADIGRTRLGQNAKQLRGG